MLKYNKPLISIGLPVFNGEEYITNCLNSLTNQTYKNFEIIICDDNSIDQTEAICNV